MTPTGRRSRAAAESLLALDSPLGLSLAPPRARRRFGDASSDVRRSFRRLLALAGDESDVGLLAKALAEHPTDAEAVGWSGASELLELLVGLFESDHALSIQARAHRCSRDPPDCRARTLGVRVRGGSAASPPWIGGRWSPLAGEASRPGKSTASAGPSPRRRRWTSSSAMARPARSARPALSSSSLVEWRSGSRRSHAWVAAQVASLGEARARLPTERGARFARPRRVAGPATRLTIRRVGQLSREGEAPTR